MLTRAGCRSHFVDSELPIPAVVADDDPDREAWVDEAGVDEWEAFVQGLDGKYTQTPLKIHKIHSVFDLEANTQIHQGGVFSPPSSKYTKYTVYLGSGGNTLNTYFPSRARTIFPGSPARFFPKPHRSGI